MATVERRSRSPGAGRGGPSRGALSHRRTRAPDPAHLFPRLLRADGLATRRTDPDVFRIVERVVDDLVTVNDDQIREAIAFLLERAKLLAETGGAAAVAALLSGRARLPRGTKCAAMICGGNFDVAGRMSLRI